MITESAFEGWAIVEIMGHVTVAGFVTEQAIAGTAMLRVDVPGHELQAEFTKFYGGAAIYGITPTTEEIARHAAQRLAVRPVSTWTVPDPQPKLVDSMAHGVENDYADDEDDLDPRDRF